MVPYYGYGRTDKKDQPRVPITARLVADLLTAAGADRLLTVDLHAGQIQGFFNIPVDELTALPILADYFLNKEIDDLVVVAVDIGITKKARDVADRMNAPLAIIEKRRLGNDETNETMNVIGDVAGKVALTFDDEIATGGTIINAAAALADHGVREVFCCVTHPILSGKAPELVATSNFTEVAVTDTIPVSPEKAQRENNGPIGGSAVGRGHVPHPQGPFRRGNVRQLRSFDNVRSAAQGRACPGPFPRRQTPPMTWPLKMGKSQGSHR